MQECELLLVARTRHAPMQMQAQLDKVGQRKRALPRVRDEPGRLTAIDEARELDKLKHLVPILFEWTRPRGS